MSSHRKQSSSCSSLDLLSVCLDQRAHEKVQAICRELIGKLSLLASEFDAAVNGILIATDRLESFLPIVEEAYQRLGEKDRSKVRCAMLGFYYSLADYSKAVAFTTHHPQDGVDFMLNVGTFIKLGKHQEANLLVRNGWRLSDKTKNAQKRGLILFAMGKFLVQKGNEDAALIFLCKITPEASILLEKNQLAAKIHVARALQVIGPHHRMLAKSGLTKGDSDLEKSFVEDR